MSPPRVPRYDAVVIGGGPAGAATALEIARRGARVALVERTRYAAARVGETFAPAIQVALARLGVWESFAGASPAAADLRLASHGVRSAWGGAEPAGRSFLFDPYGCGWHVDRRRFDAALAAAAEEQGVRVLRGARVLSCARQPAGWSLAVAAETGHRTLDAGFVVDASGRAAALARRLGATRQPLDAMIAVAGRFTAPPRAGDDGYALIEAVADGWWYTAPQPRGEWVAAFMTDPDLAPAAGRCRSAEWERRLAAAPETAARLAGLRPAGPLRTVSAASVRSAPLAGPGWLAVGDAAVAFDPLSGDGVDRALRGGLAAAAAIAEGGGAVAAYRDGQEELFAAYRDTRTGFYRREERWPDSPFWARRRTSSGAHG